MAKRIKTNDNLHTAKKAKDDEYYTLLSDIEEECNNYASQFKDQIVYCNCDNPYVSNFFKYFVTNFKTLGLKKLICTCYDNIGTHVVEENLFFDEDTNIYNPLIGRGAFKVVITKDTEGLDTLISTRDVHALIKKDIETQTFKYVTTLKGDGDFRSFECIDILKESDIIVTNPPFSLFREFIATMREYGKKFLIVGNMNAITYKEVYNLIKDNKLWLGYCQPKSFILPSGEYSQVLARWFTNLDVRKRHERINCTKEFYPDLYPKYDNYDAVEVDEVKDIPVNYNGVMGVPISFLDKYNPDQFEIVKFRKGYDDKDLVYTDKNGFVNQPYFRILIRHKN